LSRPIAFHRCFVDIAGSVNAALVLSQAFYWQHRIGEEPGGGWWYKTGSKWSEETGLSRHEQENARKKLKTAGLLREKKRGTPAKMWFRLDPAVLRDRLMGVEEIQTPVDNLVLKDTGNLDKHFDTRNINCTDQTGKLDCTNPPIKPEPTEINCTDQTGKLDCMNRPAKPEPTDINCTDQTDIKWPSWSVSSAQVCQFGRYIIRTEINTETKPLPQTPSPNESARGGGGEITLPTERGVIKPKPEKSEFNGSSDETIAAKRTRELVLPDQLTVPERTGVQTILARYGCPDKTAQEILDVLAAIILAGEVRKSPLAVLRGLLERWKTGTFDATTGLHLAAARRRKAEIEARMNAPPSVAKRDPSKPRRKPPPPGAIDALRAPLKKKDYKKQ
ncbi:MAG: hypothetical protein ACU843_18715, partial [Gammaproteobacteria bacterium]